MFQITVHTVYFLESGLFFIDRYRSCKIEKNFMNIPNKYTQTTSIYIIYQNT